MSRLIPSYIEQALRIELLERAVIASEGDVKRLERKLAEAVTKERERCAKVCEEIHHPDESAKVEERANWYAGTWACAAAIRKGE